MAILHDKIQEAVDAIDRTAKSFYMQKNKEGYQLLSLTLERIMQTVGQSFTSQAETGRIHIEEQRLNHVLSEAMNAIEKGDTILLSDILHYDLKGILEDTVHDEDIYIEQANKDRDYLFSNMECMKRYRPMLYKAMEEYISRPEESRLELMRSFVSKDGDLYISLEMDGRQYRLCSSYSPKHEAEEWVKQFQFRNINTVTTMFGLGSGTFAREIIRNKGIQDFLFIYEPCPEIFSHVLEHYDITDILSEEFVILAVEGLNDFEFHNHLQNAVNITNLTSQIRCMHPYYEMLFKESAIRYWTEIKDNYTHIRLNINTEIFFGERFIINGLYNTRFLRNSNRLLDLKEDIDINVPAIIVSAGPSVMSNIGELKRAKGKAYIFAVDRILDYLLDEGLEPDFVVTIDPIKPVEFFTRRSDISIPMLSDLVSNWEVLERHQGKKIIMSCLPYFQRMYEKVGIEPPKLITGASVATAAFSSCVQLGFKRIVLVGQDLAYDGDYSHVGGVKEKFDRFYDVMVDGVDGKKIRSRSDWYEFIIWFNDFLTIYPELEVIDAKEKGAKIKGAVNMPLSEVIDIYCIKPVDASETIRHRNGTFDDTQMEQVRNYFIETLDELGQLKKKAKEAISICEEQSRFYSRNSQDSPVAEKNNRKLSKINQFISKQSSYLLLETFITASSAQNISELYHFTDDVQTDKKLTYEKSIGIYQAIIDGIQFIKPLLLEALEYI